MFRPDPHDDDAPDDVWFARHGLTIPRMASQSRQSPDVAQRWSGSSAAGARDSGLIDQAQEVRRRTATDLVEKEGGVLGELLGCLGPIALCDIGADQTRLTALAEWLGPDRCQADLDSLAMSASRVSRLHSSSRAWRRN